MAADLFDQPPRERLNREIDGRADVAGILPNRAASLCLLGGVLMAQSDEGAAALRRYFRQDSMAALASHLAAPALPGGGRVVTTQEPRL